MSEQKIVGKSSNQYHLLQSVEGIVVENLKTWWKCHSEMWKTKTKNCYNWNNKFLWHQKTSFEVQCSMHNEKYASIILYEQFHGWYVEILLSWRLVWGESYVWECFLWSFFCEYYTFPVNRVETSHFSYYQLFSLKFPYHIFSTENYVYANTIYKKKTAQPIQITTI